MLAFIAHFNREFFNLKGQLFNLGLVSSTVLLKSKVVFFFLACCKCPLLEFLLIPIHFKFELVHALVCFEDHVLNIVKTILLVSDPLLQFLDLVF